jgi:NAD(P)-dependent dehydrogenase (short-subunit alcohol dehydrogenase family)
LAVALSARTPDEIFAVAAEIEAAGGRAVAIPADVTDPTSVGLLIQRVAAELGAPLVLVNNAGAAASHKFDGHPDPLWERMLAVNLTGTYLVTKACAPAMLEAKWGRVINIGSVASLTGARYIAAYTAAKHGVLGLTRALAAEWARRGITVNLVAPGYVDTPMTDASVANIVARTGRSEEEARSAITALSPQHRLVQPEEVAHVVRMLAAEAAGSITGAVIPVDAGASALAGTG